MKRIAFLFFASLLVVGSSVGQNGLISSAKPQAVHFPGGYEVLDNKGQVLKRMEGAQSATVQAYRDVNGVRHFLSDWSWERYRQGKAFNWIRPIQPSAPTPRSAADDPMARARKDGLVVFDQVREIGFPAGFEVIDGNGTVLKRLADARSATVMGYAEMDGMRRYLSDWSWERYLQGETPNWIRPIGGSGHLDLVSFPSPSPAHDPAPGGSGQRIALVIGNAKYRHSTPLRNPLNDTALMKRTLETAGFEVLFHCDLDRRAMVRVMADFEKKLGPGRIGLFYFAGHGVQLAGRNYLIPIDATLASESRVADQTVELDGILEGISRRKSRLNLVILDCCRNSPEGWSVANRGLAKVTAPRSTLIAYASAPGNVALDGSGTNSPFTEALSRQILDPENTLQEVFSRTATEVQHATGQEQLPWNEHGPLEEVSFFIRHQELIRGGELRRVNARLGEKGIWTEAFVQHVNAVDETHEGAVDAQRVTWESRSNGERLVIYFHEFSYEADRTPAVDFPCSYGISYDGYPCRFEIELINARGFRGLNQGQDFSKSRLIRKMVTKPIADDSESGAFVVLKQAVEYEIFELHRPARLVIQLRPSSTPESPSSAVYSLRSEKLAGIEKVSNFHWDMNRPKRARIIPTASGGYCVEHGLYESFHSARAAGFGLQAQFEDLFFVEKRTLAQMPR